MHRSLMGLALFAATLSPCANAQLAKEAATAAAQRIVPAGSQPSAAGPAENFTRDPVKAFCRQAQDTDIVAPARLFLGVALSPLTACQATRPGAPVEVANVPAGNALQPEEARMWMTVGERRFAITLAENDTAKAFAAQLPLTVHMAELNGNEKHAELPAALPAKASRSGTIHNGDLMLYGSKTLVVFYATFSSSYSYTRLGRVEDPAGLAETLGQGDARISFSMD